MPSVPRARHALTALGAALALLVASCASPPPPPAPVAIAAPPAPPPITLSAKLIEQASAFHSYMRRASAISPAFRDGDQIATSLKVAAAYEPKQFQAGATAYAAVLALQDPTFVTSVRAFVTDPAQRQQVIAQLAAAPAYAAGFQGADSAAGLIIDGLSADGLSVYATGKAVKQAAYDVQHSPWSMASVPDRDLRLAAAKSLSAVPALADSAEVARLQLASSGAQPLGLTPRAAEAPYRPLVIRGLAVAALAALGAAGDNNLTLINAVMAEPNTDMCLNMAKLNLYQCLAVSKPHYEDVFCLGQHILMDTGQCVVKASGAAMPVEPTPPVLIKSTPVKVAKGKRASSKKKS